MKDRRAVLRATLALTGSSVVLTHWKKPIVSAVVLPAHAQTSGSILSCSMTDTNQNALAEGTTTNQNFILIFSTNPPVPGESISWVGRCNGVDDFAVQNDTLDANGMLQIAVSTGDLCNGGPPNNGDIILHNGVLDSNGSTANCSVVYGS